MFSHGATVGVAVSGGRDSVCLLDVLDALRNSLNIELLVLHVNHRLRPESEEEEQFVRGLAASRGLKCLVDHPMLDTGNLEQSARQARLHFFEQAPCTNVATGHTRSDQAETVLFRFLRGTGTAGLAGVRPVNGRLVRPLIEIDREWVNAWVATRQLAYREDSSNEDQRFSRNRIRHSLLPMLEREWNPRLVAGLAGLAEIASGEDAYLESQIPPVTQEEDGAVVIEAAVLKKLPIALARRMVRRAIQRVKGDLLRIEFEHVERVLNLGRGHDRVILPGVDIMSSFEWIRFGHLRSYPAEPRNWQYAVSTESSIEIPGGQVVSISLNEPPCRYNEVVSKVLLPTLNEPLILRNWRPGDQFRIAAHAEPTNIKVLFQRFRIPLWERRNWPVLETPAGIKWSGEFGSASETFDDSTIYVKLRRCGVSYRRMLNQKVEIERLKQ